MQQADHVDVLVDARAPTKTSMPNVFMHVQ